MCVCLGVCAFVIVSLSGRCVYVCARARTHAREAPQSAKVEENTKELQNRIKHISHHTSSEHNEKVHMHTNRKQESFCPQASFCLHAKLFVAVSS